MQCVSVIHHRDANRSAKHCAIQDAPFENLAIPALQSKMPSRTVMEYANINL